MSLSPPPKNAIGFVIKEKKKKHLWWEKSHNPTKAKTNMPDFKPGIRLDDDDLQWANSQHAEIVSDEVMELAKEHHLDAQEKFLDKQLQGKTFCHWCANPMVLQYNLVRSGWMVHCTYCGASGPTESDWQAATDGYLALTQQS